MNHSPAVRTTATTLALTLGAALTLPNTAIAAEGTQKERCAGVALKGKNDGAAAPGTSCAGGQVSVDAPLRGLWRR